MKIELVTGATTYEAAVNTIKQIDTSTEHNLVVVPDAFSMQAENLIFKALNISATFNIEVVGISRLAGKILRQNGVDFKRVSSLEEVFGIYKAVRGCEDKFEYFNGCDVEMCQQILEVIKQFKACKISPEQIKPSGHEILDRKMHDLRLVFEAYGSLMSDKLDLSSLLQFFLKNADEKLDLSDFKLYFVNFDSFTLEINAFICHLAKLVGKVCIGMAVPLSPRNAHIYENDIMQKTTALAAENGILVETKHFPTSLSGQKLDVVQNLFAFETEQKKSEHFLNVVAKNPQDEVEYVAKHIHFEVAHGRRFKDFAVAVADKKYYPLLKEVFEKFGIVCNCDDAVDLTQTILGRFIFKILSIARQGFSQSDLQYLSSCPLLGRDDEALSKISHDLMEKEQEFVKCFPKYAAIVNEIEMLSRCNTMFGAAKVLENVLAMVEDNLKSILPNLDFKKQSENEQSINLIRAALERLEQEQWELPLSDFENVLKLALQSVKVETIPAYLDAVYVGDATDTYFEDVPTLFVLGAVAGALPRTQSDTGIITDDDIHNLKFSLEPEVRVLNRRHRLKLFELLQHAENLIVCCPKMVDGRPTERAEFVQNLLKLFGNRIVSTAAYEDFDLALYTPEQNFERLLFYVGCKNNALAAYSLLQAKQKLPRQHLSALKSVISTTVPQDDDFETVGEGEISKISASELECYFACPKKRYFRYVLKIKEKENAEPNKRLFGIFAHSLLKEFMSQSDVRGKTEQDVEKFLKSKMLTLAKEVYDEKALKSAWLLKFLHHESKILLSNAVKEQKKSNFSPMFLEQKLVEPLDEKVNLLGFVDRADKCGEYFRIIDYKTGKTGNVLSDLFYGKKLQLFLYARAVQEKTGLSCGGVYYFDCQTKFNSQGKKRTMLGGLTLKDNKVVENMDTDLSVDEKSEILGLSPKKNVKDGDFAYKGSDLVDGFEPYFDYAQKLSVNAVKEMCEGYVASKPFKDECKVCPYTSVCCHLKGSRKILKEEADDED